MVRIFSGLSKLSGPSGKYSDYPETFQTIRKLSRLSGKLSGPSRKYPDYPETFQAILKLFGPSGKYLESFQAIRKLFGPSGKYPDYLETSQCTFKGYAQKLSGRAKFFWM